MLRGNILKNNEKKILFKIHILKNKRKSLKFSLAIVFDTKID